LRLLNYLGKTGLSPLVGGKKAQIQAKAKITEDCFKKLKGLPEEKLRLLNSILTGMKP